MQLSDRDILREINSGNLYISDIDYEVDIQPASVDLKLGPDVLTKSLVPLSGDSPWSKLSLNESHDNSVRLGSKFYLASTKNFVKLPDNICGRVEGKSTIGRNGLQVHMTAGFIDPGFEGNITLELLNSSGSGITISLGTKICQISFYYLNSPCINKYGSAVLNSHYQFQDGVTEPHVNLSE